MKKTIFFFLLVLPMITTAQKIDWQGHRGARGLMPENSLPAFRKALELGVTTLELDVVVSQDHKVVVSHEPWFSPVICTTPEGETIPHDNIEEYSLYQMDFEKIQQYDCGSVGNPRFPEQEKIAVTKPLLIDVFRMAEKYCKDEMRNEIYYNIEIKSRPDWEGAFQPEYKKFCDLVYNIIDAYVPWRRVTIQSFDFRVLKYYHNAYPDVKLAALVESEKKPEKVLEDLGFEPEIYSPYYKLLKPGKIEYLHEKGIKVIPWTVNDREEIKELIEMGVDGIITDYPDLIKEFPEE